MLTSHLHVVDLAGSERIKKSGAEGGQRAEAVGINTSLMVLGKCTSALVEQRPHACAGSTFVGQRDRGRCSLVHSFTFIHSLADKLTHYPPLPTSTPPWTEHNEPFTLPPPLRYYESKLTMLLKRAIGGNSRTTAVVTCRVDDDHAEETLQSLRFGERCAMITNSTLGAAATSADAAIEAIDAALRLCEDQLASLEGRGMTHLAGYKQVVERYRQMKERRGHLGHDVGGKA